MQPQDGSLNPQVLEADVSEQLRAALMAAINAHLTSLHRAARTLRSECGVCRDIALAAAPSTPEPDADGFMMMHNAGRHDISCKWSRPGIIDASVDPCTCGLAEDIAAILASKDR